MAGLQTSPWSCTRLPALRFALLLSLLVLSWNQPAVAQSAPAAVVDAATLVARLDPASPVDMSADRPPLAEQPERVKLPHRFRRLDGNTPGVFWYRFDLPPLAAMPQSPAIFLPRLTDGVTFYLNGTPVLRVPGSDALKRVRWRRARAFVLPAQALQAEENVLTAKVISRDFTVSFPYLLLGPQDDLQAQVENRQWLDQYGSQFAGITALIIGAFILCIWWFRRDERYYLLFGLSSLLWAVRTLNYSVEVMPTANWWWWRALHFLVVAAATGTLAGFFLSFAGLKMRRWGIAFAIYAVLGPIAVIASNGHLHDAVYVWWQGPLFLMIIATLARFAWWGYHHRSVEVLLITTGVILATALAANDYATMIGVLEHTRVYTLHFALPVLLLTIGALLTIRFVRALRSSENANAVLAERLAQKERELAEQFDRMRLIEQRTGSAAERQRIMQDMHDGLGAQLVSSLVMVEHGAARPSEIATLLREALDEMRLAIDAFGQVEVDLVGALASLRHRMEPRFHAAGISLLWSMDDAFGALQPDEHCALQLLRIVQEALSNAIKHSGATEVRMRFEADQSYLRIIAADDGCGFGAGSAGATAGVAEATAAGTAGAGSSVRRPLPGHGITGLRKRAHALGGDLGIDTSSHGTTIVVSVPLAAMASRSSATKQGASFPAAAEHAHAPGAPPMSRGPGEYPVSGITSLPDAS